MNKWPIILGTLSAILLGGLFGGSSVNAVSNFDNLETVDKLELGSSDGTKLENVTDNWATKINDTCPALFSDYQTALSSGNNPAWALVQHSWTANEKWLYIYYTDDIGTGTATFAGSATPPQTLYTSVNPPTSPMRGIMLGIQDNGDYYCFDQDFMNVQAFWYTNTNVNYWSRPLLINNIPIDYPPSYEGEIIPDTYTPPIILDWIPDFHVLQGIDYKVTIQDKSFNTFDEVPFTCNDGLAPVIKYEIRDSSNEIVVIGQFSATIQLEQQLPKNNVESTYTIIGNYDCGFFSDPTQPDFSGQASKEFTITAGGLLVNEVFTSCFIETAPFIDFENCLNNMADTVGMLSFGSIKFSNNWQFDSNCRELAVLGGWIGLEGSAKVICPQFPEYIRNVVTPFVTLILGFITLKFITSRGGSGI